MKVLMFGWEFPPYNSGGLGVACWGLTQALAKRGVDVLFVLPKRLDINSGHCKILFADPHFSIAGINSILLPYVTSEQYKLLRGRKGGVYGHSLAEEVLRYAKLSRELALANDFDVIHAHDWLSFLAGVEAKRATGKPLVVHIHATEFDRVGNGPVNQFVYDIERDVMHEADRVVTVSNFTKGIIIEKYGVPVEKVRVVHNGLDESDYLGEVAIPHVIERLKKDGNKIVLFVGRITLQKGPDYFVKLAKRIMDFYPKVYFVVAGSGDMQGRIIEDVARLGLGDRFIFTGFLRNDDLRTVYQSADIYIMPSVSEPFGIAPLEAVAHGVPTLISKQAGVGEVLTHTLKADFWDIDEMTNKVVSALRHPSLGDTIRAYARHELRKINWNEAAEKCILLYNEF